MRISFNVPVISFVFLSLFCSCFGAEALIEFNDFFAGQDIKDLCEN